MLGSGCTSHWAEKDVETDIQSPVQFNQPLHKLPAMLAALLNMEDYATNVTLHFVKCETLHKCQKFLITLNDDILKVPSIVPQEMGKKHKHQVLNNGFSP